MRSWFDDILLKLARRTLARVRARQGIAPPALPPEYSGLLGDVGLHALLAGHEFSTVLDVGSGAGRHAAILERAGKVVTRFDQGRSRAFTDTVAVEHGDFLDHDFGGRRWDCIWACHVLEHTGSVDAFLGRLVRLCRDDGVLAITVPPARPHLVGGHLSLWTTGLLVYRLVLAGLDCSAATCLRYGYNITVIVRKRQFDHSALQLAGDRDDLYRLRDRLPSGFEHEIDGDELGIVYRGHQRYFL